MICLYVSRRSRNAALLDGRYELVRDDVDAGVLNEDATLRRLIESEALNLLLVTLVLLPSALRASLVDCGEGVTDAASLRDSRIRSNLRFLDSMAYDIVVQPVLRMTIIDSRLIYWTKQLDVSKFEHAQRRVLFCLRLQRLPRGPECLIFYDHDSVINSHSCEILQPLIPAAGADREACWQ